MSRSFDEVYDDLGEIIDKRGLRGSEVHMLYRLFCTKLHAAMEQGETDLVMVSLEKVSGDGPTAESAAMGRWGPN